METIIEKKTNVRPPIVVVMGHIDHGKTKILDWYRNSKVVEQESGGITQHIGAYEVEHKGKKITFIDTPGHEAFSKMRSRGANVADTAILVVAADEGVKPQTKEAIDIIKRTGLPYVVAINKIDKPESNPERVKQQLAEVEVLVESYGGQVPSVEISAKSGQHMDDLLEVLLLVAEIEDLTSDIEKPAEGVVIEAHLDPRRGTTATLLLRNGGLARGDALVIGHAVEVIKIFEDFRGKTIESAGPSQPVRVVGLTQTPMVGDSFKEFESRKMAEKYVESLPKEVVTRAATLSIDKPIFNIILKADVVGSKEVLEEMLNKFQSDAVQINIIKSEVGDINESDVKLAMATKLVTIVGFKVKMDGSVRELAERANTRIVNADIIYEVVDAVKKNIEDLLPPEIKRNELGKAKILKLFKKEGQRQIIGGRVEDGKIAKSAKVEIRRLREVLGSGTIVQLQREKREADEVGKGAEFGVMIDSKVTIQEGDVLEIFQEEVIRPKL